MPMQACGSRGNPYITISQLQGRELTHCIAALHCLHCDTLARVFQCARSCVHSLAQTSACAVDGSSDDEDAGDFQKQRLKANEC